MLYLQILSIFWALLLLRLFWYNVYWRLRYLLSRYMHNIIDRPVALDMLGGGPLSLWLRLWSDWFSPTRRQWCWPLKVNGFVCDGMTSTDTCPSIKLLGSRSITENYSTPTRLLVSLSVCRLDPADNISWDKPRRRCTALRHHLARSSHQAHT